MYGDFSIFIMFILQGALKVYKKGANFEGAHDREALLLELVYETSETANNHIGRLMINYYSPFLHYWNSFQ